MNERNADVSKTLTDKWKKGELPSGWYWVKGVRAEGIYAYTSEYLNNIDRPADGEKIVEKVPSYEEWQAKLEENTKLKELLKECVELMGDGTTYMHIDVYRQRKKDVLNAISQVLGE